jgi:hypothetical protein
MFAVSNTRESKDGRELSKIGLVHMPQELPLASFGCMINSNHLAGIDNQSLADNSLQPMQEILQDPFYLLKVPIAYEISVLDLCAN